MKSFEKEYFRFDVKDRSDRFEIPALLDGGVKRSLGRVDAKPVLSKGRSFNVASEDDKVLSFSIVAHNYNQDFEWKYSFGEYLYEAMDERSIYPRHIAEETELSREYVDRILEDQILPWDLSPNLICYLNQRLGLDSNKTKKIIAEHDIDQDLVESLHYSPSEFESLDSIDPVRRKVRFQEFLVQEEFRRKKFLQMI